MKNLSFSNKQTDKLTDKLIDCTLLSNYLLVSSCMPIRSTKIKAFSHDIVTEETFL